MWILLAASNYRVLDEDTVYTKLYRARQLFWEMCPSLITLVVFVFLSSSFSKSFMHNIAVLTCEVFFSDIYNHMYYSFFMLVPNYHLFCSYSNLASLPHLY